MPEATAATDATLGETLHRLLHAYRRALRQAYERGNVGLAVSHIRTLKTVACVPDCTAQAIVARTDLDKAQITRTLNELSAAELIEKHEHPSDGRSSVIVLTPSGKTLVRRIKKLETQAGVQMAHGLAPDELAEFVRLANRMLDNLSE